MDNNMAERIEALGSKVEEKRQYIVVKLGNEQFGIDISLIEFKVKVLRKNLNIEKNDYMTFMNSNLENLRIELYKS